MLAIFDCKNPRIPHLIGELPVDFNKVVFIGNKVDLVSHDEQAMLSTELQKLLLKLNKFQDEGVVAAFVRESCIFVSTLSAETQGLLVQVIESHLDTGSFGDDAVLSQARHFENLQRASECLTRASELAEEKASPEFLALEVKEGLIRIQEVLGERFDDQILDRVFSEFCIGK